MLSLLFPFSSFLFALIVRFVIFVFLRILPVEGQGRCNLSKT